MPRDRKNNGNFIYHKPYITAGIKENFWKHINTSFLANEHCFLLSNLYLTATKQIPTSVFWISIIIKSVVEDRAQMGDCVACSAKKLKLAVESLQYNFQSPWLNIISFRCHIFVGVLFSTSFRVCTILCYLLFFHVKCHWKQTNKKEHAPSCTELFAFVACWELKRQGKAIFIADKTRLVTKQYSYIGLFWDEIKNT